MAGERVLLSSGVLLVLLAALLAASTMCQTLTSVRQVALADPCEATVSQSSSGGHLRHDCLQDLIRPAATVVPPGGPEQSAAEDANAARQQMAAAAADVSQAQKPEAEQAGGSWLAAGDSRDEKHSYAFSSALGHASQPFKSPPSKQDAHYPGVRAMGGLPPSDESGYAPPGH